jgi:hypothetical protein
MKAALPGLGVLLLAGLALWGPTTDPAQVPRKGAAGPEVRCFVLLSADAFLCGPCLGSWLDFRHQVPEIAEGDRLWAVVLCPWDRWGGDPRPYRRMVSRRTESAFRALRFEIPVVVDAAENWERLSFQGAGLVVMDGRTGAVHGYPLPLTPDGLKAVRDILQGVRSDEQTSGHH